MVDFAADIIPEPGAISLLSERAQAFLSESGVDARAAHHVALVLDELLTNAASHGSGGTAPAKVRLMVEHDRVDAEVWDCGANFDPRRERNVELSDNVSDRPIGGLGLLLVQRVTEGLDYARVGDRNRVTFRVRRTPE